MMQTVVILQYFKMYYLINFNIRKSGSDVKLKSTVSLRWNHVQLYNRQFETLLCLSSSLKFTLVNITLKCSILTS